MVTSGVEGTWVTEVRFIWIHLILNTWLQNNRTTSYIIKQAYIIKMKYKKQSLKIKKTGLLIHFW